jgi:CPA2 family monovalent cation:H+ antiporter-2
VVFLLFDIGLHFSVRRVWSARREMFGMGALQMLACAVPVGLLSSVVFGFDPLIAMVIGAALALSSTAVVTQVLADTDKRTCPLGHASISILVFQDIAAIFLLILAEAMGGDMAALGPAMGMAALSAAAAFAIAVLAARFLVEPVFRALSATRNEDVFAATALLLVLFAASASAMAGLSLTLGAFLAGMMIADSPYRHVIQAEMKPFRGLLMGFFFIVVGVSLDVQVVQSQWPLILGGVVALTLLKIGAVIVVAKAFRWTWAGAVELGFLLGQASEFALVIFAAGTVVAAVGAQTTAVIITLTAASLALAPLVAGVGARLARSVAGMRFVRARKGSDPVPLEAATDQEGRSPILVVGMTPIGRLIADALETTGIAFLATDSTYERFTSAAADGYPVVFGDMADPRVQEAISMGSRPGIVVTTKNYEVAARVSPMVRERFPDLKRFIWVEDEDEAERFAALGMTPVILRSEPRGVELALAVARWRGADEAQLEAWLRRRHDDALSAASERTRTVKQEIREPETEDELVA